MGVQSLAFRTAYSAQPVEAETRAPLENEEDLDSITSAIPPADTQAPSATGGT